jgi:hypothetical protein
MSLSPISDDMQPRTLRAFTILHHLRRDWGGALILNIGLDPQGAALSLASNIAGAVCLTLEQDHTLLRESQRTGSCDFIVNTLDEAIRVMKNEIRQHKPLSVGLEGNPTTAPKQILERGLAPQLFASAKAHPEAASHFQKTGALLIDFEDPSLIEAAITPHQWQLQTFTFKSLTELRTFDTRATALLEPQVQLRRKWLQTVPRILPRDRTRTLWLTAQEQNHLAKLTTEN